MVCFWICFAIDDTPVRTIFFRRLLCPAETSMQCVHLSLLSVQTSDYKTPFNRASLEAFFATDYAASDVCHPDAQFNDVKREVLNDSRSLWHMESP